MLLVRWYVCRELAGAVVNPALTEEVASVLKLALARTSPITARGMGSGLAAASVPSKAALSLASRA